MFCISVVRLRVDAGGIQAKASSCQPTFRVGQDRLSHAVAVENSWSCVAAVPLDPIGTSVRQDASNQPTGRSGSRGGGLL
jgi:hypothetical protein